MEKYFPSKRKTQLNIFSLMGSVRETDNQLSKIQVQDLPKPTQLGDEVNTLGSLFDQKVKPFKVLNGVVVFASFI